jgi:hypothetical protein
VNECWREIKNSYGTVEQTQQKKATKALGLTENDVLQTKLGKKTELVLVCLNG